MSEYITTQQAAILLNTTDRTIRRRLAKMSAERPQLSAYVRREQGNILIDIRLVRSNFERIEDDPQPEPQEKIKDEPQQEFKDDSTDIVQFLKEQITIKDKQIKSLQRRNKELNYMLRVEQKDRQLLLSSPILQTSDNLNNAEKPNSEVTANASLQWLILSALAIIIILLIFLYMGAFL